MYVELFLWVFTVFLRNTICTLNSVLYNTAYSVQCCTVLYYSVQCCTVYTVQCCTVHNVVQCTAYNVVQCAVYNAELVYTVVQCTVCNVVQCTMMNSVQCTILYNMYIHVRTYLAGYVLYCVPLILPLF